MCYDLELISGSQLEVTTWHKTRASNLTRRAKLARNNRGIVAAPVPNDAERRRIQNWNGEQRNSLQLPTLFRAPGSRCEGFGKDIGLQTMQKIRSRSEANTPCYRNSGRSIAYSSTTGSRVTYSCSTYHLTARGSGTDESADDRHTTPCNDAAQSGTADISGSRQRRSRGSQATTKRKPITANRSYRPHQSTKHSASSVAASAEYVERSTKRARITGR